MKSIKMFGKSIPILAIVAIAMSAGMVGAALVGYLSNKVTTRVTVESPIELNLYGTDSQSIAGLNGLLGGESLGFSKIAYNNADAPVPFAIVLVIKGTDGDGIIVDSVGPKPNQKETIGTYAEAGNLPWNSEGLWYQNEGEAWYLHDAYNKYDEYGYYVDSTWTLWGNPQNTAYDDGGSVKIGDIDYYVIVFGGTIGTGANGLIGVNETITNEGWGTPSGYTHTPGRGPLVMQPGTHDVGKVRVNFVANFVGEVVIKMQVVMPGYTVGQIITEMFP